MSMMARVSGWAPTVRPRPCDLAPRPSVISWHALQRPLVRRSCTSDGYSRVTPGCVCPELAAGCETDRMALKPTRPLALAECGCSANPGLPRNPSQVNSCRTSKLLRQSLHHSTRRWLKKGRLTSEPCRSAALVSGSRRAIADRALALDSSRPPIGLRPRHTEPNEKSGPAREPPVQVSLQ
jgi:hypothetical protein